MRRLAGWQGDEQENKQACGDPGRQADEVRPRKPAHTDC